jgi:hypothetical protein
VNVVHYDNAGSIITSVILQDGSLLQLKKHNMLPEAVPGSAIVWAGGRCIISELTPDPDGIPVSLFDHVEKTVSVELVKERFLYIYDTITSTHRAVIIRDNFYQIISDVNGAEPPKFFLHLYTPDGTYQIYYDGTETNALVMVSDAEGNERYFISPKEFQVDGAKTLDISCVLPNRISHIGERVRTRSEPVPTECEHVSIIDTSHHNEEDHIRVYSIPSDIPNCDIIKQFRKKFCRWAPKMRGWNGFLLSTFENALRQEGLLAPCGDVLDFATHLTFSGNIVRPNIMMQDSHGNFYTNAAPYLIRSDEKQVVMISMHALGDGQKEYDDLIDACVGIVSSWVFHSYPVDHQREFWIIRLRADCILRKEEAISSTLVPVPHSYMTAGRDIRDTFVATQGLVDRLCIGDPSARATVRSRLSEWEANYTSEKSDMT